MLLGGAGGGAHVIDQESLSQWLSKGPELAPLLHALFLLHHPHPFWTMQDEQAVEFEQGSSPGGGSQVFVPSVQSSEVLHLPFPV